MKDKTERVLVVAERPVLPAYDGARLRLVSLLQALSDYEVDLIHFKQFDEPFIPVEKNLKHCRTIAAIDHDNTRTIAGRLRSVVSANSYGVWRNRSKLMERFLGQVQPNVYSIAIICGLNMAHYRSAIPAGRALLDVCDSDFRAWDVRYRFVANPLKKAYCAWENRKRKTELERCSSAFDEWIVISEVEAESLHVHFPHVPTSVVGNSLLMRGLPPAPQLRTDLLVLTGNFGYYPNVDAVSYFVAEIMPLLRRARPGCRLRIIGANPPAAVRKLASEDIEVTGFVEDFAKAVSEGTVFVCPLRIGTGIKNKVLEAMELGVPVVSTRVGMEGIVAQTGVHYLHAENASDFAECILRLLRDPNLRGELVRAASQMVRNCFSCDVVRAQLHDALARVGLAAHSRTGA